MRITVLTGGTSPERDVAIASAVQVVAALRTRGHRVSVVDTARGYVPETEEATLLPATVGPAPPAGDQLVALERGLLLSGLGQLPAVRDADVLFVALHGGWGEDGTLQAMLEVLGIPYTGSGPLGSTLAMNKDVAKRLFRSAQVPTPDWLMAPVTPAEVESRLGWPAVVKPARQGSSVGLSVVRSPEDLATALVLASRYDAEVMVEAWIPGRELTVGILENEALAVGEIIPRHEYFDYECKYQPGMAEELFPAPVPEEVAARCRQLGLAAHRVLKLGDYSRADFRLTPGGDLFCLEVNALPGLTATSLLPQSARAAGIPFEELCERICLSAMSRARR
jgi:D-alanine-D-alanine ligase